MVDPGASAHSPASPHHWLPVEHLDQGPPLATLEPILGVVSCDQVVFVHDRLAPWLVHTKIRYATGLIGPSTDSDAPAALCDALQHRRVDGCALVRLWGQRVPLVCVCPPNPALVGAYVIRRVYGCQCMHCRGRDHAVDAAAGYLDGR